MNQQQTINGISEQPAITRPLGGSIDAGKDPDEASKFQDGLRAFAHQAALVGSWVVTAFPDGAPSFQNLSTFTVDGGVLNSDFDPLGNPGNGVWVAVPTASIEQPGNTQQTKGAHFNIRFIALRARVRAQPDGTISRIFKGRVEVVSPVVVERAGSPVEPFGNTFSGTFVTKVFDENNKEVREFKGKVRAERIQPAPVVVGRRLPLGA